MYNNQEEYKSGFGEMEDVPSGPTPQPSGQRKQYSTEFESPSFFTDSVRHIRVLNFERVDGQQVGAKFVDRWGKVNRITFHEIYNPVVGGGHGKDKIMSVSSYSFYLDFKAAKIKPNDEVLVTSLNLPNPYDQDKSYRKWVFQVVYNPANNPGATQSRPNALQNNPYPEN